MGYNELKKSYDNARMELANLDSELVRIKGEITMADNSKSEMRSHLEKQLLADKAKALDNYKLSKVRPVEEKISKLSTKLEETQSDYKQKSDEITFDNVLSEHSSKQEILESVKDSSSILTKKLQDIVGKRFYKSLMKQVNTDKIELDVDGIEPVINYFNRSNKKLSKLSTEANFLDKAMQGMESLSSNQENKSVLIVISVILIVCTFLFPMYLSIVMMLLITISIIYNIFRNYSIYQTLCVVLAVEANIDKIESSMHEEVSQEVEKRKEELDSTMLPKIEQLQNQLEQARQELIDTEQEAGSSFLYDATSFEQQRVTAEQQMDERKANLIMQKSRLDEEIQEKVKLIKQLESELTNCTEEIKTRLMTNVGTAMEFSPDFVIDIKDNKPVAWKHPRSSSLVLYKDQMELYNFIKLLIVQLRGKLIPSCLSIIVVDFLNMGQPLQMFADSSGIKGGDEFMKPIFKIDFNDEQWKSDLDILTKDLTLRQKNIAVEFKTIENYNKKMVELEAIPEKYKFVFMIEPELSSLSGLNIKQLLRIGETYGIYFHLFISYKELQTAKGGAEEVLENVKAIYALENGTIKKRAKEFILSQVLAK